MADQAVPEETGTPTPRVRISYAVDESARMIYWRCEAPDCPSSQWTDERFIGYITFPDRPSGMALLGAIAVAHAHTVDNAVLEEMIYEDIIDIPDNAKAVSASV